jgi:hypothetical protein
MCKLLKITRSYYYKVKGMKNNINEVDQFFLKLGITKIDLEKK